MERLWSRKLIRAAVLAIALISLAAAGFGDQCLFLQGTGENAQCLNTQDCGSDLGITTYWCVEVTCDQTFCGNGGNPATLGDCEFLGCDFYVNVSCSGCGGGVGGF